MSKSRDLADLMAGFLNLGGFGGRYEREYRFAPPRRWRADIAFVAEKVIVECDGGSWTGGRHTTGSGFEKDCEKLNEAAVLGWLVLRFTTGMVKSGAALETIRRIIPSEVQHD